MSFLDIYRSDLQRERERAIRDQHEVADLGTRIGRKQAELGRANTPSRLRSRQSEIARLTDQRARAERSLAARQKTVADLEKKVLREELREQKRVTQQHEQQARKTDRSRQEVERTLVRTSAAIGELQQRVAGLEESLLARVRDAVAGDPVVRQHDVFLSHAGPDKEVASELYAELTARQLDVWFDGAELRLGESLTRQIDRGIASSRLGVILITPCFLEGRSWTEREMGGLFATRRRVIPILDGVTFDDLAQYSPLLADLVGLSTENDGLDGIAERISQALAEAAKTT